MMKTHFFSQEQRRSEFCLNVKETKMWHNFEELKQFKKMESILP